MNLNQKRVLKAYQAFYKGTEFRNGSLSVRNTHRHSRKSLESQAVKLMLIGDGMDETQVSQATGLPVGSIQRLRELNVVKRIKRGQVAEKTVWWK